MTREKRNGYRPVIVKDNNEEIKGYLICFNQESNIEEGIGLFATVEIEDGSVHQFDAYKTRFDDIESTSNEDKVTEFVNGCFKVERVGYCGYCEDYAMVVTAIDERHAERCARVNSEDFRKGELKITPIDMTKEQVILVADTGA